MPRIFSTISCGRCAPAEDLRTGFACRQCVDHAAQRTGSEYVRLGREDAGGTNDGGAGCVGHARCRGGVNIGHQQLRPCLVQHLHECDANVTDALNGDRAVGQWPMQPSVGGKLHRKKDPPRAVHGDGSPPTPVTRRPGPYVFAPAPCLGGRTDVLCRDVLPIRRRCLVSVSSSYDAEGPKDAKGRIWFDHPDGDKLACAGI